MPDTIMGCWVDLRRNWAEFPFESTMLAADKPQLIDRVTQVLEPREETWTLFAMRDLTREQFSAMEDMPLLERSLWDNKDAAVFIRADGDAIIYVHHEDHLLIRVRANCDGMRQSVQEAKDMARLIAQTGTFAKDDRIGWLTARPQYAGTGLQVTYLMHLPMLSMMQQTKGLAARLQREHRFSLTPQTAQGEKNPACLFRLQNLFTAYDGTEKLMTAVGAVAEELTAKEDNLRRKILTHTNRSTYLDQVFRAYGILKYARRLTEAEFLGFWSKLRLGASAGLLPVSTDVVDQLLKQTAKEQLLAQMDDTMDEHAIHFIRADVVRAALNGG